MSRVQLAAAAEAGELAPGLDPDAEGALLFFAVQGLIGPVLLGVVPPDEALRLLDGQVDRLFR